MKPFWHDEFIKDILKVVVVSIPLLYFFIKGGNIFKIGKRLGLIVFGFVILLIGCILDFTDEFAALNDMFLIGANYPHHEKFEDVLAAGGFVLFALGIASEIRFVQKENKEKAEMVRTLELQTSRLRELDKLKSEFVSTVSHELRTPLVIIGGTINNILMGVTGEVDGKLKKYLHTADDNIKRLDRLVSDLLDYSRIDRGVVELKYETIDFCLLVKKVLDSFSIQQKEKYVDLTSNISGNSIMCELDVDKFTQVLTNLIHNAWKFTPENGKIVVSLEEKTEEEEIQVTVQDNGIGIKQQDLEKLFQRFVQIDRKEGQGAKGTGLGLAIVKGIIEAHGGKIWATSRYNEGSQFIFTVPLQRRGKENSQEENDESTITETS